jgi:hypothetical protein
MLAGSHASKIRTPKFFIQGVLSLNLTSQAGWVTAQGTGGWLDPTAGLGVMEKRKELHSRLT